MSTSFEITGKLHSRSNTEQITDSFRKREFVILVMDGEYEQYIKFELLQDNCSKIDGYGKGDEIKVTFNVSGREWNGKYFVNLKAWRIDKAATVNENPPAPIKVTPEDNGGGDLPF